MADRAQRDAATGRARWPYLGRPQVLLLVAGLITMVASFLPWLDTAFGSTNGAAVGGLTTFCAGLIAVPGAILRRRLVVVGHALVLAIIGIAVPAWRLVWALDRLPALGQAWLPGSGLLLVLISGGVAAYAAAALLRARATDAAHSPTTRSGR